MGTTGTDKPLLWPHTWPQSAQCRRCIALGGMDCPSAGDGKQLSLHVPTVGNGYQEFCADHFEILSRFPDLAEKISRLIVDVCHAEVKGKLYRLR